MYKIIYGSLVWLIVTLFVAYGFCLNTAAAVFADAIKTSLHISDFEVSCAAGSFIVGFACMQIPAGLLLDRFNARFIVSGAILLVAIGNILISYSTNIYTYSLANLIQGMGSSFGFLAASILVAQWFSPRMFPILTGLIETIVFIFTALIHYYLVIKLKTYSWSVIYQSLALFGFALFVVAFVIVKSPPDYSFVKKMSLKESLSIVVKNKQIWLCAIAAATSFGVLLAYGGLWYLPIQEYYSVENSEAVLIGGMIFIGIAVGTPILGWISNKVQSRKMILHLSLVLGNMGLIMAIYLPHYLINTYIIIKIVSFFTGFMLSGYMLIYTAVSEMSSNQTRGVALSIISTCVFLYNTIMLLVPFEFITATSTQFFTYLWVLPFSIMISILLIYFIKETYPD